MSRPPHTRASSRPSVLVALAVGAAVLLALAVVACGSPPVTDSGVQGEVRLGPVNPVEQPGVPNDRPYVATLRINRASDGKLMAETRSAADGLFRVALAPGGYVLEPVNGDPLPIASPQEFVVAPGRFTTVRVDYDSGIR